MRKIILLIVVNIILVALQQSFIPEWIGLHVNLVLAFAMSFFVMEKSKTALVSAFIGGLVLDLLGFGIVGKSSLVFVLVILIFDFVRDHAFNKWYFNLFFVFLSSLIYSFFAGLPKVLFSSYELFSAVGTLLASLFFYYLLLRYKKVLESSSYKIRE